MAEDNEVFIEDDAVVLDDTENSTEEDKDTDNIIPFVIILTVLVFVHELGHYSIARYNGVKVEVFSIGFGKELFGFTDTSGTRWKFSLVPLGGYVKMHGDLDEASSKKNTKNINPDESFHEKTLNQRLEENRHLL